MSKWLVIGAVLLAIVLAGLTFWPAGATRDRASGGNTDGESGVAGTPILESSPSRVEAMAVQWRDHPGAGSSRVVRGPLPEVWLSVWTDDAGVERRWPVAATSVRGALRLLHETRVLMDGPPLAERDRAAMIEISAPGRGNDFQNSVQKIWLTRTPLDGKRRASTQMPGTPEVGFLMSEQIASLFEPGAMSEWLERGIFPPAATPVGRIELTRGGATVVLGRVAQMWSVRSPLVSGANRAKVNEVLLALQTFTISRITDSIEVPTTPPIAVINAEMDRPSVDGDKVTRGAIRYRVEMWAGASERAGEIPARATVERIDIESGSAMAMWGPVQGVVSVESLAAAMPPIGDLLGRQSLHVPTADVRGVRFSVALGGAMGESPSQAIVREWTKQGDRWKAGETPLVGAELENLSRWLALLCETPAETVKVLSEVASDGAAWEISMGASDAASGVVATLRMKLVGADGGEGDAVLLVRAGRVERGYDVSTNAALRAWLTGMLPSE